MKKVVCGVVWFIGFSQGLLFMIGLGLGVAGVPQEAAMNTIGKLLPLVYGISLAAAILGTIKQMLPGTREKKS